MGCFNKIAMVSSLPIEMGDDCVLIFMSQNNSWRKDMSGVVYPHDYFVPTFLPIFGEYDDYGRIENVKETTVTKFILDFFGESNIEDFISKVDDNAVGRGGESRISVAKNDEVFKKLTFGLEHKSVYDKLSSEFSDNMTPATIKRYMGEFGSSREVKLNGTGFTDGFLSKMLAEQAGKEYIDDRDTFINEIGIDPIVEFLNFSTGVSVLNAKYFPSNYGSQSQEHTLHYKMLTLYRNIIVKKFDRYDEKDYLVQQLQSELRDERLSDVLNK